MRPKTRPQVGHGRAIAVLALLAAFLPVTLQAQDTGYLARALEGLRFREIGPAVMGGRVADLAVNEANPAEFYVGFASGGVWKTTNQGMSWTPIFDRESTASIGDVTLAPSNPNILWVGTGEPQNRQSSPWGDGVYKSVDGGRTWRHVGLRETRHIGRIIIHPTNPDIVWVAAVGHLWGPNEERGVFRTKDGGATWEKVLYIDENTGAIDLAIDPGVLYVGTDDGMLHVTRDGGATWTDITGNVPGLVHGMLVSGIEPSRHVPGRVYLAFDGHQIDDYRPYVFVSEDYGRKWKRITEGLPAWSVNVVREHPRTADLLFVGNEIGAYVSFDRGGRWHRLTGNLPTVPVDDIVIHPRENDLILATHGRSIWVLDDASPLEALTRRETLTAAATLFPVRRATAWALAGAWPFWGDAYAAPNPPDGAILRYWIGEAPAAPAIAAAGNGGVRATAAKASPAEARRKAAKDDEPKVRLSILDAAGTVVRTIEAPGTVGLHEVVWDLRLDPPYAPEPGAGQGGGAPRAPRVLPGTDTVRLETDAVTRETSVEVRHDPRIPVDRETLAARQRALLDLYALARPLYEAGRAATKADERIQAARKLLDAAEGNDALRAQADTLARRLGEVRRKLAEAGRAGRLAAAIEGVSARPTDDQLWQIDEAWRTGPEAIRSLNEILTASLPALEAAIYHDAARPRPIEPVAVPGRSVT